MAFKRTLVQRIFNISKVSNQTRISPSSCTLIPPNPEKAAPEHAFFRRFLQRRPLYQSAADCREFWSPAIGDKVFERLRDMDIARDRIRLEGLIPPAATWDWSERNLTVEDARKLLRLSQLETVKMKLNQIQNNCISYTDFVQICIQGCSNTDQGQEFAKMLDQSGTVIALGNVVYLKPHQIVKAMHGLIPVEPKDTKDPRWKELEEMERRKFEIDQKAEALVRRELWCGLGYLVVQTAAFMRLTFWELTWDVMEPICFYVTSFYFMAGYAFFLRTSKEPSFEGFFQSRFAAKQRRLMKAQNFDFERYNQLRNVCYSHSSPRENNYY